jgi:hypothetical protein
MSHDDRFTNIPIDGFTVHLVDHSASMVQTVGWNVRPKTVE